MQYSMKTLRSKFNLDRVSDFLGMLRLTEGLYSYGRLKLTSGISRVAPPNSMYRDNYCITYTTVALS